MTKPKWINELRNNVAGIAPIPEVTIDLTNYKKTESNWQKCIADVPKHMEDMLTDSKLENLKKKLSTKKVELKQAKKDFDKGRFEKLDKQELKMPDLSDVPKEEHGKKIDEFNMLKNEYKELRKENIAISMIENNIEGIQNNIYRRLGVSNNKLFYGTSILRLNGFKNGYQISSHIKNRQRIYYNGTYNKILTLNKARKIIKMFISDYHKSKL